MYAWTGPSSTTENLTNVDIFPSLLVIICEDHTYPFNMFVGSSLKAPREDKGEYCYWFSG